MTSVCTRGSIEENVKQFYGKQLKTNEDFKTDVCTVAKTTKYADHIQQAINKIHEEISKKYYGCGGAIPDAVEGKTVLDMGCGCGRDVFVLSHLVGESGSVIGIDMTEEQLAVANNYLDYHARAFNFSNSNVKFTHGYIEKMGDAGIEDGSVDIVISNCVLSLCADKSHVFREAYRVLKYGGEMIFCDMYCDRRIPDHVKKDESLWGEGLTGALFWEDMQKQTTDIGFSHPRLVKANPIAVKSTSVKDIVGDIQYAAATYRLFKLALEEPSFATFTYTGGIVGHEDVWKLDHGETFQKDEPRCVNEEVASILTHSRFANNFDVIQYASLSSEKKCGQPKITTPFEYIKVYGGKTTCCGQRND